MIKEKQALKKVIAYWQKQLHLEKWNIECKWICEESVHPVKIIIHETIKMAELTVNLFYPTNLLKDGIGFRLRMIGLKLLHIETSRLYLRHLRMQDFDAEFDLESRKEVAIPDGYAPITDPIIMEQKLVQMCTDPGTYGIIEKESQRLIGHISIRYADRCCAGFEIGYGLHPDFWQKGYATEIAQAVVDACFTELSADMVIASHFKDNMASKRVIEKLKMTYEGCIRNSFYHELYGAVDLCTYSILKEEWNENLYKY